MTTAAAIANHLQIAADLITEIQEWASVLWVRIMGRRPRFVSKKVTEEKMTTIEESLERIGRRWQKNGMDRIYFSDLHEYVGLELTFYGSGNVSSAKLNGTSISNSEGRKLAASLNDSYSGVKLWWDVPTQKFIWKNKPEKDLAEKVIRGIANAVDFQPLWDLLDI
jgi:hypothetical protein